MAPYHRSLLADELKSRKAKNPRYSLRAFSKLLDVSPSHLSLLMRGRKPLTAKLAHRFIEKLDLGASESAQLLEGLDPSLASLRARARKGEVELSNAQFDVISEWHYFAILSLARTKGAKAEATWVAKRLGIDVAKAHSAIDQLESLGLLKQIGGLLVRTSAPLATSHDVPSSTVRKFHRRSLENALAKLDTVPIDLRSYSSITFPCDLRGMKRAKDLIEIFKRRICEELETRQSAEVYTLAVQLFPLTEVETR